jgi:iron complex outermembrane receptor protein
MKIEQAKIADLKSNGAVNLSSGITAIPGVESISTGMSIGKPVIRGLSSNRVLVYTQGVRLENQQFGGEHGLGINDAGIESVEVIKGPASLLYGSDALGGVLYLNPERFANQNTSQGDINYNYFSNTSGSAIGAGFKSSSNNFKLIFRGSMAEHADYKTNNYRATNTRFQEKDFKSAIGYQNTSFSSEFRYNLNASKLGIPEEIGIQNKNVTPLEPFQNINNHVFSSKTKLFLDKSTFELNIGYIYNDRKEFEDHHHGEDHDDDNHDDDDDHEDDVEEEEDPALHMKLKTFNYYLKYNLPRFGKFETIIGVQGMNQINTNYGEEELIPNATTNDVGVLGTSHIHFENLDVQIGARFDNRNIRVERGIEKRFNSFNAAFGIKTQLFNFLTTRLNVASGFRAPNLAELTSDGGHEGANRYEIGNANLNNEKNLQIDLAFEHKSEHVEIYVNGFYNKVNNYIFLSPNGNFIDDDPVYLYIEDDAKLFGGEIGLHFHPHPLDWLHVESSFETVTGKQQNDEYLPLIPANKLSNTLRFEIENASIKKANAFVKFSYTFNQKKVNIFETNTDGYGLLSAGFGGELLAFGNPLTINISGNNLTNKIYINHLSRLKPDGIANMGRNISVGISYQL